MSGSRDAFLQYGTRREIAARFESASVAALYRHRPEYPPEVLSLLEGLALEARGRVLDAGAGTGKLARALVARGFEVDAVDASAEMIGVGRRLPGGADPALRWIAGRLEEVALEPGFVLAVAGASFHWFDRDAVLPRLHAVLAPGARLAVVDGDRAWNPPWGEAEQDVMIDFVTRMLGRAPVWEPVPIEDERLVEHPLFDPQGARVTAPVSVRQRLEDYVACQHSRATFSRDVMGPALADAFDAALTAALEPHAEDGWLRYSLRSRVEWGRPLDAAG